MKKKGSASREEEKKRRKLPQKRDLGFLFSPSPRVGSCRTRKRSQRSSLSRCAWAVLRCGKGRVFFFQKNRKNDGIRKNKNASQKKRLSYLSPHRAYTGGSFSPGHSSHGAFVDLDETSIGRVMQKSTRSAGKIRKHEEKREERRSRLGRRRRRSRAKLARRFSSDPPDVDTASAVIARQRLRVKKRRKKESKEMEELFSKISPSFVFFLLFCS